MKIVSFPLYNFLEESQKKNYLLNFNKENFEIKKIDIVGARSYSLDVFEPDGLNTFYQISFKFDLIEYNNLNNDSNLKERIVVIEKRESDMKEEDWRICLID